jgi:hypothetical protein
MKTSFHKFMASNAVIPLKIEMALIDDAKAVDVNFNKLARQAEIEASQAEELISKAIKNLTLAMAEVTKAEEVYKEIEKSTAALGLKPTDLPYTILVNEVIMDSAQWEQLLDGLKSAQKGLSGSGFF